MPKSQSKTKKSLTSTKKNSPTKAIAKTPLSPTKPSGKTSLPSKKKTMAKSRVKKIVSSKLTESLPTSTNISRQIPNGVRIFFGCALLLFCIAIYQAFLRPSSDIFSRPSLRETNLTEPSIETSTTGTDFPVEEILISNNVDEWYSPQTSVETLSGAAFIEQFYQVFSQKDIVTLTTMFDAPLQKSADIKRFFSEYKITPFIDNIENHSITPYNISLENTSPSGVEEYSYIIDYHLIPQNIDFEEQRTAKIRYTDQGPKIASIRCETARCSYNPFFRPENYGLLP